MLSTPTPLTEKMTLFWHNHFATSQQKVRSAQLMYRQNVLLRSYALGNFGALLREISKDPAMLVYLDGAQNRKGAPNENFARELMELFTLGEGQYNEADIKEVAPAPSPAGAWSRKPVNSASVAASTTMVKRRCSVPVAGPTATISSRCCCASLVPANSSSANCGRSLCRRSRRLQRSSGSLRYGATATTRSPLMRAMLLSDDFWSPANRASLVKSPVDLVIGSLRQFRFSVEDPAPFAIILRQLGQDLFGPPNVKGWPVAKPWLNTTTLLARKGFLNRLFRADEMLKPTLAAGDDMAGKQDMVASLRLRH